MRRRFRYIPHPHPSPPVDVFVHHDNHPQELQDALGQAVKEYDGTSVDCLAVVSACDILRRFITRLTREELEMEFDQVREVLRKRAQQFLKTNQTARARISEQLLPFLRDGSKILIHGYCPTVLSAVAHALKTNNATIYVTEARPTCDGYKFITALKELCGDSAESLEMHLVPDSAVASVLPEIDVLLLGAKVITENGGVVNTIGSFQVATLAKAMHKPVYVCSETLKLARIYPLDQTELPQAHESPFHLVDKADPPQGMQLFSRSVDYTPPQFITQVWPGSFLHLCTVYIFDFTPLSFIADLHRPGYNDPCSSVRRSVEAVHIKPYVFCVF